jgi:hypothetical protein
MDLSDAEASGLDLHMDLSDAEEYVKYYEYANYFRPCPSACPTATSTSGAVTGASIEYCGGHVRSWMRIQDRSV